MDKLELEVELRSGRGKGPSRRLRAQGGVPATLYGAGTPALSIQVGSRALERLVGTNQIIGLTGPSEVNGKLVLLKEFQRDPLSRVVVHADFYAVDTHRTLEVSVPIHFGGRSVGVELGGVFEALLREVEVRCLPLTIPEVLNVDISHLNIEDAISAAEIALPEGVELITDPRQSICHVTAPRKSTEDGESEEGAAAADGAEDKKADSGSATS